MKEIKKYFVMAFLVFTATITAAQTYSHLGAWYYGTSFKALEDGYIEGFSVYTNAPTPNAVHVWLLGPYNNANQCKNEVNGSGSTALNSANDLIKYQSLGSAEISYTGDPAPAYSGAVYGLGYVQSNPDKKVTVEGVLEEMEVKKNKYYLIFFAVSNATYSGNDYRLTRVVSNNKTSGKKVNSINENPVDSENLNAYSSQKKTTMTICHAPPGNPTKTKTLEINVNSWSAHQAHGDVAGVCPASNNYELDKTWYLNTSNPYQKEVTVPLDIELTIEYSNEWKGNSSNAWSNKNNWSRKVVPVASTSVTIESGNNTPSISGSTELTDLTVESGATLVVSSSSDLTVSDNLLNSGTIEGEITLNGTSAQLVEVGTIESLDVNNAAGVTLTGNTDVTSALVLTDGTLDVNGYDLVLKSDATSTSMIVDAGGTISGNVIVERYTTSTGNGHHFISAPVSDAIVLELDDDFNLNLGSNSSLYYYDEPSSTVPANGWIAPTTSAELMVAGRGFTGFYNSGKTVDISGEATTGAVPVNVTNDGSGWNLIGNPYPSPLDWDLVNVPSSISGAIYVWDAQGVNGGIYTTYFDGLGINGGSNIIPHMQGFFVKATSAATLTFQNDDRITDPAIQGTFFKSSTSDPLFRLLISGQGYQTEAVVRFKSGATNNYDVTADAIYLPNGNPAGVEFATVSDDNYNLVINSMPLAQMNATIPVYTTIGTNGLYTIDMTEFINFSPNFSIVLNDLKLGTTHLLNNGAYTFTGDLNDNANRFEINTIPLSVDIEEEIDNKNLIVYYTNNELHLKFNSTLTEDKQINIYNILGQNMISTILNKGDNHYTLSHSGLKYNAVYIIDIENIDEILKICLVK